MLKLKNFPLSEEEEKRYSEKVSSLHLAMEEGRAEGSDYLGWLYYASTFPQEELERLVRLAQEVRARAEVLVVAGIGGSYLGAEAMIKALAPAFGQEKPEIIFCGNNLSGAYLEELLAYLEGKNFYVNVISKSGRTLETALAFRFLKEELIKRHGDRAGSFIIATTDPESGALRRQVEAEGYESFAIPPNLGGRYSVMSPVGLFPMAVAGLDVKAFLEGFIEGERDFSPASLAENKAYQYALTRRLLYDRGYLMEILVSYEPSLVQFSEWYKQLFGESEGKDGGGIFPVSVANTTDLHSLGQIIQDGPKIFFETVLAMGKKTSLILPSLDGDDGLSYLEGEKISTMTGQAMLATLLAHEEAGVTNLILELDDYSEKSLAYLMYFMMRACAMSSYLGGVNPFDQPGVEAYKNNMLALMGSPDYRGLNLEIREKLKKRGLI